MSGPAKLARDCWLILDRQLLLLRRGPVWLILGVVQPLLYLLLFGPLMKSALRLPTTAQAYQTFVPGLLVMLAIYGTLFAGFGLIGEQRAGVVERTMLTPVSRTAMVIGRSLREVVSLLAQSTIIVALAVAFGLRIRPLDLAVVYLLLTFAALLMSTLSYAVALRSAGEETMGQLLNAITQPLLLLSGILLPITAATAPGWLVAVSRANPMSWIVEAVRALFGGDHRAAVVWWAILAEAVLTAAALAWTVRILGRRVR
ncbi:ABC transporter permease [Actinoplanes sp. HUAS TT8]|uniref:ABC transporter permease n=1 Tax=Actinoplanes sp. HUAS TT8 TaxID=3447453 RepID=UPI003F522DD7